MLSLLFTEPFHYQIANCAYRAYYSDHKNRSLPDFETVVLLFSEGVILFVEESCGSPFDRGIWIFDDSICG